VERSGTLGNRKQNFQATRKYVTQNPKLKTQNSKLLVSPVDIFLSSFQESLANESFRKLTLGKFRGHLGGVEHVYVRSVALKDGIRLSFVSHYPDHDLTQNHLIPDGVSIVQPFSPVTNATSFFSTAMVNQELPRVRSNPSKFNSNTIGKNPD
jgi:hypothetical protein